MHLNQQLAAPLKRFCAKLLGDCKEFNPEVFFLAVFIRSAREDMWHFIYTFSHLSRNLTALGVTNAIWSVELSIQVQFSRFLYMPLWNTNIEVVQG